MFLCVCFYIQNLFSLPGYFCILRSKREGPATLNISKSKTSWLLPPRRLLGHECIIYEVARFSRFNERLLRATAAPRLVFVSLLVCRFVAFITTTAADFCN